MDAGAWAFGKRAPVHSSPRSDFQEMAHPQSRGKGKEPMAFDQDIHGSHAFAGAHEPQHDDATDKSAILPSHRHSGPLGRLSGDWGWLTTATRTPFEELHSQKDGPPECAWRRRLNADSSILKEFRVGFREAMRLAPLGLRMYFHVAKERKEGRLPVIDPFNKPTVRPTTCHGVPIGGVGCGGMGRGWKGDFLRYQLQPGLTDDSAVPANNFSIFVKRKHADGRVHSSSTVLLSGGMPKSVAWLAKQRVKASHSSRSNCFRVGRKQCCGLGRDGLDSWRWELSGERSTYFGLFPRAWTVYDGEKAIDSHIVLTCRQVSPVIPHNYEESSLPCCVFVYKIVNTGHTAADVSIMFSFQNSRGSDVQGTLENKQASFSEPHGVKGVILSHRSLEGDPLSFALACQGAETEMGGEVPDDGVRVSTCPSYLVNGRMDIMNASKLDGGAKGLDASTNATPRDAERDPPTACQVWEAMEKDGSLDSLPRVSSQYRGMAGAVAASVTVPAGETRVVAFSLAWDNPIVRFGGGTAYYRRYTEMYGRGGNAGPAMAHDALMDYPKWEEQINEWQRPVLNNPDLPVWYKCVLFNELYYLVTGGSVWIEEVSDKDPHQPPRITRVLSSKFFTSLGPNKTPKGTNTPPSGVGPASGKTTPRLPPGNGASSCHGGMHTSSSAPQLAPLSNAPYIPPIVGSHFNGEANGYMPGCGSREGSAGREDRAISHAHSETLPLATDNGEESSSSRQAKSAAFKDISTAESAASGRNGMFGAGLILYKEALAREGPGGVQGKGASPPSMGLQDWGRGTGEVKAGLSAGDRGGVSVGGRRAIGGGRSGVGKFLYLEGVEYLMWNTYDVHFYASFALLCTFPELELAVQRDFADHTMRGDPTLRAYLHGGEMGEVKKEGAVPHDLGNENPWVEVNSYNIHNTSNWKDLNAKFVLQVYRDYVATGNLQFAIHCFPAVKKALEYACQFDRDCDGIIENEGFPDQTYDTWTVHGVSAYCGGLWLAAMQAGGALAQAVGDAAFAKNCLDCVAKGKKVYEDKLWNGKYFNYDMGNAGNSNSIQADQLAGQWFTWACGLAPIVDHAKAQSALRTVFEYNVMKVKNGSIGAVNGMRPNGKIDNTCMQSREVWTGVTYGVAAVMLYEVCACPRVGIQVN
eukprot:jgi/Mesvir1/3868/Mv19827-RA.2